MINQHRQKLHAKSPAAMNEQQQQQQQVIVNNANANDNKMTSPITIRSQLTRLLVTVFAIQFVSNWQSHSQLLMISFLNNNDEGTIIQPSTQQHHNQQHGRRHIYGNPNQTTPLADHPHAGAIDEYGNYGYVHDPTILKQNPPTFHISMEEQHDLCAPTGNGPEDGGKLGEQIFDHHIQVNTTTSNSRDVKVFCAVYSHPGNSNQTDAIRETWGRRCDGFMVASSECRGRRWACRGRPGSCLPASAARRSGWRPPRAGASGACAGSSRSGPAPSGRGRCSARVRPPAGPPCASAVFSNW